MNRAGATHEILSIFFNDMLDSGIFEERIEDVDEPAARAKTTPIQANGQNWKYSTDYRFPYSSCDQHLSCVTPGQGGGVKTSRKSSITERCELTVAHDNVLYHV
ncbi:MULTISPECIES: hypothetical protein [Acidiphilium]|uniref:hypothetical protein n=1 Tax=Acidiphilium TaxID=522 RepID=UPI00006B5A1B|nr:MULTISPECIES: hypothetical protein [Acidiphilium]